MHIHSLTHTHTLSLSLSYPPTPLPHCTQTKNAHRRLEASLLEGADLPLTDGGPAELQDVMRVLLALAGCDARDASMFVPLLTAALDLLPDIREAALREPAEGVPLGEGGQGAGGSRGGPGGARGGQGASKLLTCAAAADPDPAPAPAGWAWWC